MGTQQQDSGDKQAGNAGGTGVSNSHAAGSGSSTGDPGNARGAQPTGKGTSPSRQGTSGASPDDHIEAGHPGSAEYRLIRDRDGRTVRISIKAPTTPLLIGYSNQKTRLEQALAPARVGLRNSAHADYVDAVTIEVLPAGATRRYCRFPDILNARGPGCTSSSEPLC